MPSTSPPILDGPIDNLCAALIDDTAVFPPGNFPLTEAVERHHRLRAAPYAKYIGPLLIAAANIDDLIGLVRAPIDIGLIARPGVDPRIIEQALKSAAAEPRITISGIELA